MGKQLEIETPEPKVSEILQAVVDKLSDPDHWTTKAFARDVFDVPISPREPEAYKFCTIGAMRSAFSDSVTVKGLRALTDYLGGGVPWWNDMQNHESLIKTLTEAVEYFKKKESDEV